MAPENTQGWNIVLIHVFFRSELQLIVAGSQQPAHFIINTYASPCVDGSVLHLSLCQFAALPVGEAFRLADALYKEVGIDLHQALILDAQFAHHILKVDEMARFEVAELSEREHIVVPSQSHLRHRLVAQEPFDRRAESDPVQPEEEAFGTCRHL